MSVYRFETSFVFYGSLPSKVASHSVRYAICEEHEITKAKQWEWLPPECFRFTVCRNPLSRLFAVWNVHFNKPDMHKPLNFMALPDSMPFADFVPLACDVPDGTDEHLEQ